MKTSTVQKPEPVEGHYVAPNGLIIEGTLETCPGCALITSISKDPTTGADYAGDTKTYWDDQRTITRRRQTIFVDSARIFQHCGVPPGSGFT